MTRRHSMALPDPRPWTADQPKRAERKAREKDSGGFTWEEGLTLALMGATVLFSAERSLKKCEKRHESEDKQRSGRKESRSDREPRYPRQSSNPRESSYAREPRPREDYRYDDRRYDSREYDYRRSRSVGGGNRPARYSTW